MGLLLEIRRLFEMETQEGTVIPRIRRAQAIVAGRQFAAMRQSWVVRECQDEWMAAGVRCEGSGTMGAVVWARTRGAVQCREMPIVLQSAEDPGQMLH